MADRIILGTRKGVIILNRQNGRWDMALSQQGVPVSYAAQDPRSGTIWAALEHGHWGPKLARSKDGGESWEDAPQIKYPEGSRWIYGSEVDESVEVKEGEPPAKKLVFKDAKLLKLWTIQFGHESQTGRVYVGTIPGGLFVSDDDGESFELNMPLWNHESRGGDVSESDGTGRSYWFGGGAVIDGTYAPGIHSIAVDPRDPKHYHIAVSCAGTLETKDDGQTWEGRNKGQFTEFLPEPNPEWGADPHFVMACKEHPDHLWMQNHCGIYYSENRGEDWAECSKAGDDVHFGFAVAADEKDPKTAWVVPAIGDDVRMAKGGVFVAKTEDGGKSWVKQTEGLPQDSAWDLVYRHALDIDGDSLVFGSTTGNLYLSENRGDNWINLGHNFPQIYSVRFA
ncbi:MAG: sialidase family protein [Planctomycetota bacterium]|jgi:hypothetical protein